MATSTIQSGGMATFTIKVNGSAVDDTVSIHSVEVEKRVNRIARATVVILDGEPNTGQFVASSSATFVPGASISIEAGYDNQNQVIFTGIITGQSLRVDNLIGSALEVQCRDAAVRMTVGRKSLTFANQKDSNVMSSIIGTYSGLSAKVTATNTVWPEQVQYYVTDWDYVLSRADANGFIVTTLNGTVAVAAPDANTSSVLTVTYGDTLMEFSADLDAINQLGNVTASSWDFQTQAVTTGQATPTVAGPGNLSSKTLSQVVGLSEYDLQTTAPLETGDLTAWAKAQLVKSAYSKILPNISPWRGWAIGSMATISSLGWYMTCRMATGSPR
jgi:phage protein D